MSYLPVDAHTAPRYHGAVVYSSSAKLVYLYLNGAALSLGKQEANTLSPADLGIVSNRYIGRSVSLEDWWEAQAVGHSHSLSLSLTATPSWYVCRSQFSTDPYFNGRIFDLRFYDQALRFVGVTDQREVSPTASA